MLYTYEELELMGYKTKEQISSFIDKFIEKHGNCFIRFYPQGVVLDYDYDTTYGLDNLGYIEKNNIRTE